MNLRAQVAVAEVGTKKWIITISGSGARIPNLQGIVDALKKENHSVDWARTLDGRGHKVLEDVQTK